MIAVLLAGEPQVTAYLGGHRFAHERCPREAGVAPAGEGYLFTGGQRGFGMGGVVAAGAAVLGTGRRIQAAPRR